MALPTQTGSPVSFDVTIGASSSSESVTVPSDCTLVEVFLAVNLSVTGNELTTGATLNGVAMTGQGATPGSGTNVPRVERRYLLAPSLGAQTIAITFTGVVSGGGWTAVFWKNVDHIPIVPVTNVASATSAAPANDAGFPMTITSNQLGRGFFATHAAATTVSSEGTGQTQLLTATGTGAGDIGKRYHASTVLPASSPHQFSWGTSASKLWRVQSSSVLQGTPVKAGINQGSLTSLTGGLLVR